MYFFLKAFSFYLRNAPTFAYKITYKIIYSLLFHVLKMRKKVILKNFNVPVPKGEILLSKDNILETAKNVSDDVWVVKAQIHAGGRGKGGGVKIAKSLEEVENLVDEIMGMQLITHQTGPEGEGEKWQGQ